MEPKAENMRIRYVGDLNLTNSGVETTNEQLAQEVLTGLSQTPKRLSSLYFYDDKGSDLFEKITQEKEYYLYNCEKEVLTLNKQRILDHILSGGANNKYNIVELGAGDGSKTRILLEHFLEKKLEFKYMPIDISHQALTQLSGNLEKSIGRNLKVEGIIGDNLMGLQEISKASQGKAKSFVLFLGSSIGNFGHEDSIVFLRKMWNYMNHGDMLLLGVDLQKNPDILLPAYKDAAGYTTEFNLNLLDRLNKVLDGGFDRDTFQHYHSYNPRRRCMESWLMSVVEQDVWVGKLNKKFHFDAWEGIHVEDSFKYNEHDLNKFASSCGFEVVENVHDSKQMFTDSIWRVVKQQSPEAPPQQNGHPHGYNGLNGADY